MMGKEYLRVIDANFNRAKEALRVAEDCARFFLEDKRLTDALKRCRHELTQGLLQFPIPYLSLVECRDSQGDIGKAGWIQDKKKIGWRDLMIGNMKRGQEALRVLEEFSKILAPAQALKFQGLRFRLYELERKCLQKF